MKGVITPSSFQGSVTKYSREADREDKLIRIDLGGGALIPIARAERLVEYYQKQSARCKQPVSYQVSVIQTHYHRIARETLSRREVVYIFRHRERVGAWVSDRAISVLHEIDGHWVRQFDRR